MDRPISSIESELAPDNRLIPSFMDAHYEHFISPDNVRPPIPEMVRKVKEALAQGAQVVIFTARVNAGEANPKDSMDATIAYLAIAQWSKKVFGTVHV